MLREFKKKGGEHIMEHFGVNCFTATLVLLALGSAAAMLLRIAESQKRQARDEYYQATFLLLQIASPKGAEDLKTLLIKLQKFPNKQTSKKGEK